MRCSALHLGIGSGYGCIVACLAHPNIVCLVEVICASFCPASRALCRVCLTQTLVMPGRAGGGGAGGQQSAAGAGVCGGAIPTHR